jgi:hypothetical protein
MTVPDLQTAADVSPPIRLGLVALGILAVNLPFGFWRAGLRKLSPRWFVAVHAPVPLAIALRWYTGLPFRLATLPLFVVAFFGGQFLGGRLRHLAAPPASSADR